jgi:hypothetical protein
MSKTLYVGNLAVATTAGDLRHLFARYGTVMDAQIATDQVRRTGRSLGFGYVEMADGAEAAIAGLNGALYKGRASVVNEARRPSEERQDSRFSDVRGRFGVHYGQPESPEFREVVHDLQELAGAGHIDAARMLADIIALPGPYYDPESAYKWYYIALSQQGYTVRFEDHNHTPPYYCGPVGDFRNESMVGALVDVLGFDKVRSLDADAGRWLAERGLTARSG